jgi:hypothetical protein
MYNRGHSTQPLMLYAYKLIEAGSLGSSRCRTPGFASTTMMWASLLMCHALIHVSTNDVYNSDDFPVSPFPARMYNRIPIQSTNGIMSAYFKISQKPLNGPISSLVPGPLLNSLMSPLYTLAIRTPSPHTLFPSDRIWVRTQL